MRGSVRRRMPLAKPVGLVVPTAEPYEGIAVPTPVDG
jgi:hypothetical protein